jgi:hypothetical protein
MFGPLVRGLYETSQGLLVLDHGPAVELLGARLLHNHVHEIFVTAEGVTVTHQGKQLGSVFDLDDGRKNTAIAVLSLSCNEKVTGDLVVFNPDVNRAHHLPFVNRAVFLVQSTKVPCCFDTFFWDIPKTTSIWKTYATLLATMELPGYHRLLTRESRQRLNSMWKLLAPRFEDSSKYDQEEQT